MPLSPSRTPNQCRLVAITPAALLLVACAFAPAPPPLVAATQLQTTDMPAPPGIDTATTLEQDFRRWIADFRATALAAGIDEATVRSALGGVTYLAGVVEQDRAQPEFSRTVWDYLDRTVSERRVTLGQDKLVLVRAQADAAVARYGVPASILMAIWGMESNYGANVGNTPVVDALATLGFDGRRGDWARGQLLAALTILQSGDITPAQMIGSWAGAMGQTQFLPSNFLAYAVDADGDGRRDIWDSPADVLASTANFLARSGWEAGQPWGAEVRLPSGFDFGLADPALRQSSARWAADGVRAVAGAALPELADGSVFLPAGARGPAFLVGGNFRVILRYNNSTSYALAVGLLAQRLEGGPGVQGAWPRELSALTRSQVLALQTALNRRGFDSGSADGIMGPATRGALRRYQRSVGLAPDGFADLDLLQRLELP